MEKIIIFEPNECYLSLPDFYTMVAKAAGIDVKANTDFDCRHIKVTKEVQEEIFDYYKFEEKYSDSDLGFLWVNCGPKASLDVVSLNDDYWLVVEIDNEFIMGK